MGIGVDTDEGTHICVFIYTENIDVVRLLFQCKSILLSIPILHMHSYKSI